MAPRSSKKALTLCLFQSLAGVIFGWGNSSGGGLFNMEQYSRRFGQCGPDGCALSTVRQSAITGLLCLGAMFGAVFSGNIADRIGLRVTCMLFIFIHMIGAAIECSGKVYQQVYVARVLIGLGIGATSGLVPVFQAEAAPPRFRGIVTGSFQLCVTLGIWGVSMCSWGMHYYEGNKSWEVVTGLPMAFDVGLLLGFLFMPESPAFLAKKGKWEQCRKALASLRSTKVDDPALDEEMEEIADKAADAKKQGQASYREIFSTKNRILYRVMVGVCVQIGQQITGVNFFFSYGPQFAKTAGLNDAYVFQIIISSVNVFMSFPGMYAVDHFGRRPVLIIGALTMFIGQIITGSVSKALPDQKPAGNALIAFSCIFIAGFAASWGPVAWVVCGESFPIRLSALCVTLGTAANWLFAMIIAFAAPQIQQRIGTGICFVWAGCLALNFLFALFFIPETKGLSIEEIDALYLTKIPAIRTGMFMRDSDREARDKVAAKLEAEKEQREAAKAQEKAQQGKGAHTGAYDMPHNGHDAGNGTGHVRGVSDGGSHSTAV